MRSLILAATLSLMPVAATADTVLTYVGGKFTSLN